MSSELFLITELDAAVDAHLSWTQKILQCAVLRTSPGADVLDAQAHTLCRFGGWFAANRASFEALDATAATRVECLHRSMHDAIRSICGRILSDTPGREADLLEFSRSQTELLGQLAEFKTLILSNVGRQDPLTGLPLRHGVEGDYALLQKDAWRHRSKLYAALIDVDHFKAINDAHGHPVGDLVLVQLARTLRGALRDNEPLYRYGGEEFLWLLDCKSAAEAAQAAGRVLEAVARTSVQAGSEALRLSVTIGMAEAGVQESLASVLSRADQALYAGKRAGRNRCVLAQT